MQVDKREVERRFRRSMGSYEEHAVVQKRIAERLAVLAREYVEGTPSRILEVGCGTGMLTGLMKRQYAEAELWVNDLVAELCGRTGERYGIPAGHCLPGDAEKISFPGTFDLIVSASTFQWFAEPEAMLSKLGNCLRREGVLLFSTFGERNMQEIRRVTGHGLVYPGLRAMEQLLSRCFEVEYAGEECHVIEFAEPLEDLRHLKRTGVNASGVPETWTHGKLLTFSRTFNECYGMDGRVPLTYHPMYFVCKKKENLRN